MQTILGGGGPIGLDLARILPAYTETVRIVGRNPRKVIPENEVYAANLLDSGTWPAPSPGPTLPI